MITLAVRIEIHGKVQGVWFRANAKKEADQLKLVGFVKNQPDGSVLIEVTGSSDPIYKFISWCCKGPANADVTQMQVNKIPTFIASSFEIQK